MSIQKQIGSRIKELRKQKGYSQSAFALECDIERTYINHLENGRKNVSIETLEKVLSSLQISFSDFFENIGPEVKTTARVNDGYSNKSWHHL